MKSQRLFLFILVIVNLALLGLQFTQGQRNPPDNVPAIVRAHAFEIVDDHGHVRDEIKILPAQPNFKMPDGTVGYPETVQLRLISSKSGPNVKLGATEDGAGMSLDSESGYVQLLSR